MEVFERKAADNKYLHRDFHISMNMLMEYISNRFGRAALTDYLKTFSKEFHKQRKTKLSTEGLSALKDYFEKIYSEEEWKVEIDFSQDKLILKQNACPGISYIRSKGFEPIKQYIETYTTVYHELCKGTPYEYEMVGFNDKTGACTQVFKRRSI